MSDIPVRQPKQVAETVIDNYTPEAEQRLLSFVEQQVEKMKAYAKFNAADGQPGFFELNKALSEHQLVWLGLVVLNSLAKVEYNKAKESFDDWFAEKYIEIRDQMNPRSVTSTKWYSTKEIEMQVRVTYRDKFHELERAMTYADFKLASIRRLMDGWANQQFVLSRLSKNVEAEFGSGKLEDQLF